MQVHAIQTQYRLFAHLVAGSGKYQKLELDLSPSVLLACNSVRQHVNSLAAAVLNQYKEHVSEKK